MKLYLTTKENGNITNANVQVEGNTPYEYITRNVNTALCKELSFSHSSNIAVKEIKFNNGTKGAIIVSKTKYQAE